jgi:hypothetical protein
LSLELHPLRGKSYDGMRWPVNALPAGFRLRSLGTTPKIFIANGGVSTTVAQLEVDELPGPAPLVGVVGASIAIRRVSRDADVQCGSRHGTDE